MHNVAMSSLALAIVLSACGGGGGGGGTQPPPTAVFTSLTVTPTNPALVHRDTLQMSATARDQNNAAIPGLGAGATFERLSGTAVSVSAGGRVIAEQPGPAQIRASLTSGATTHTATTNATVSALDPTADVSASGAGTSFSPDTVKIAVNGDVTWTFTSGGNSPHNVTFATAHPQGNIGNTTSDAVTRRFATAGRFPYQCTLHGGMNGVVIVRTP